MKNRIRDIFKENMQAIKEGRKEDKLTALVYFSLRVFVFVSLVYNIIVSRYESALMCIFVLFLFLLPILIEKNFRIKLPSVLETIILLFIFCALILGEINHFYIKFPYWDTILHTLNGFICAAVGFSLVDILNQNEKFKFQLSPLFLALVAFCFSMTVGVVWEFFEFAMDMIFDMDMQKDTIINNINSVVIGNNGAVGTIEGIESVIINGQELGLNGYLDIGLMDTMKDLIVNFIGAVIFSSIGFIYVKNRGKKGFASNFIPVLDLGEEENKI